VEGPVVSGPDDVLDVDDLVDGGGVEICLYCGALVVFEGGSPPPELAHADDCPRPPPAFSLP
jgi:hypothetical protein